MYLVEGISYINYLITTKKMTKHNTSRKKNYKIQTENTNSPNQIDEAWYCRSFDAISRNKQSVYNAIIFRLCGLSQFDNGMIHAIVLHIGACSI